MHGLSDQEIEILSKIFEDYEKLALRLVVGDGSFDSNQSVSLAQQQLVLSKLSKLLSPESYKNLTYSDLDFLIRNNWNQLKPKSAYEIAFSKVIIDRMVSSVKNMADAVREEVTNIIIDNRGKSTARITSILTERFSRYIKNWHQIVTSEMRFNKNYTLVSMMLDGAGVYRFLKGKTPEEIKVFVSVSANACEDCKRDYLNADGTPRIFILSELLANGVNVGRSMSRSNYERLPVVPPYHVHCYCVIMAVSKQ